LANIAKIQKYNQVVSTNYRVTPMFSLYIFLFSACKAEYQENCTLGHTSSKHILQLVFSKWLWKQRLVFILKVF